MKIYLLPEYLFILLARSIVRNLIYALSQAVKLSLHPLTSFDFTSGSQAPDVKKLLIIHFVIISANVLS